MSGELFVVATPIGNLSDMVPRAIQVLQSVDLIAAENPRHSAKLMEQFGITTRLTAYHDHNENQQSEKLLKLVEQGKSVALISDAGTPLVSDPGFRLVSTARQKGLKVTPVPGACAAIAALSVAGLPSDRFSFEGFPPGKHSARLRCFESLKHDARTLVFYEAPHRIESSLVDMVRAFGPERKAMIGREITKTFETFLSGSLKKLIEQLALDANQKRGEFVIIVSGNTEALSADEQQQKRVLSLLMRELPLKKAVSLTAEITGGDKKLLYGWGVALNQRD